MKKQIIITEENGLFSMEVTGFSVMEVLGVLRFNEKKLFVGLMQNEKPKQQPTQNGLGNLEIKKDEVS
jgi:hypothetical protein